MVYVVNIAKKKNVSRLISVLSLTQVTEVIRLCSLQKKTDEI